MIMVDIQLMASLSLSDEFLGEVDYAIKIPDWPRCGSHGPRVKGDGTHL